MYLTLSNTSRDFQMPHISLKHHTWAPKALYSQPHTHLFSPSDPTHGHRPVHALTLPPASNGSLKQNKSFQLKKKKKAKNKLDILLPPPGCLLWASQLEVTFSPLSFHLPQIKNTEFRDGSNRHGLIFAEQLLLNKHQAWCQPPALRKWLWHNPYPTGGYTLVRRDRLIYTH